MSSPLISPGLIRRLRTVANRGLQTEVQLQLRLPPVETPYGDDAAAFSSPVTMLAWVREQGTADLKDVGGVAGDVGDYRVHMEATVSAQTGDRVLIDGQTYEVQDSNLQNTYRVFTTVMLKRRQP